MRGKRTRTESGETFYKLNDGFNVFDNISNTPKYWQIAKYEMIAKLNNLGPFAFFFTLSCADLRWDENFTALLRGKGLKIVYEINGAEEITWVVKANGEYKLLRKYLEEDEEESFHELVRRNIMTATRNYKNRFDAFIKNIVMDKSNPMSITHWSTKLEFQGRGAPHNHGVLWADLRKIEFMVECANNEDETDRKDKIFRYHLKHLDQFFDETEDKDLQKYVMEGLQLFYNDNTLLKEEHINAIQSFARTKLSMDDCEISEVLKRFVFFGLRQAFKKFESKESLLGFEERAVINFANKFTTVSLNPATVGEKVSEIAKTVNIHKHTRACRKYGTSCRFGFSKLPSWKTLIARPLLLPPAELKEKIENYEKVLRIVKELIDDEDVINKILLNPIYDREKESSDKNLYERNRELRIKELLVLAGLKTEADWDLYLEALQYSANGFTLVMARDLDEINVNSYNPEWVLAWNGNLDIQICLDYFAVITYVTDYFTKDDLGTMNILREAIRNCASESLKEKMKLMMDIYLTHRQMGESEAIYKIFPDFRFKDSNITCIFLPTSKRSDRSKFLIRVDEKPEYKDFPTIMIEGKEGEYIEKYDIVSKYERRRSMKTMCLSQFAKMYTPSWKVKPDTEARSSDSEEETFKDQNISRGKNKFDFVMVGTSQYSQPLDKSIELANPNPGEAPFMRKRSSPAVLRFHKYREDTNAEEYWFSECLLYLPFQEEEEISDLLKNTKDFDELRQKIHAVKCQVMEFIESAEEARLMVDEATHNDTVGETLNSEIEQDINDCQLIGNELHEDYIHINPDNIQVQEANTPKVESSFRPIALDDKEILLSKSRKLDYYQKKVVSIGIRLARNIRKNEKSKTIKTMQIKLMVNGGAGCGKSTVINILKQWVHLILQKPGDNPEHPYVIVAAPTGTAAANVKGQTMHSAFAFPFGNEHFSLSDKKRDITRTELKNLKLIIIDEISMVKADQLYQLDLRLREITQKPLQLFGGVSIICFGDLLQLQPCRARYIFDEPKCEAYRIAYDCETHWKSFDVVTLEENHRQDEDQEYANILNRIRIGSVTEEDIKVLETRVRPEGHPDLNGAMYLTCTNASVSKLNKKRLNEIDGELFSIEAVNLHPTSKNFKPSVDKKGAVMGTPFMQTLELKIGSRVMLTYNIDVADCLTNGARGLLVGLEKNDDGIVYRLYVEFDEECQGAQQRKRKQSRKYPRSTVIERVMFSYMLSKKSKRGSNTAKVYQFPIIVCFAATAHKFQGQTIIKPNKAAMDLRTVFQAAMVYVMLSRIQHISQLFIIGSLPSEKIYACKQALDELERLDRISQNKNPSEWEKDDEMKLRVSFLNCHSLLDKIMDIKEDSFLQKSDLICLSETWLKSDDIHDHMRMSGYNLVLNSLTYGKGLATYVKSNIRHEINIKYQFMQLSKFSTEKIDIISVYRSQDGHETQLINCLLSLMKPGKSTVIGGDFNICQAKNKQNSIAKWLNAFGFQQLVTEATHIEGGHIDHIYVSNDISTKLEIYSPYYTSLDHDALCLSVSLEKGKI